MDHIKPVDTSNDAGSGKSCQQACAHITTTLFSCFVLSASRPKDAHLSNSRLEQAGISTYNVDFDSWWNTHIKPNK
jgi:hypothetical protein